jgi:hypothetical protein
MPGKYGGGIIPGVRWRFIYGVSNVWYISVLPPLVRAGKERHSVVSRAQAALECLCIVGAPKERRYCILVH